MDEFVVLLILAVVIIGGLMVVGTPLANWAEGNWTTGGVTGNYKSLASFDLGKVGLSDTEVSRTLKFGSFTLGQDQEQALKEMSSLAVSQGYFGSDPKKFDIAVDQNVLNNIKDVKISFGMGETNLYGNLIIKWNEKVVFDKLANLNHYDVVIPPEDVKDSNTLELTAATPGLYFWAATSYVLQDFAVAAEYGPEKFASFKIYPTEIEGWNKGVLRFYTNKAEGAQLTIKLNGQAIYSATSPDSLVTKEYQYSEIGNAIRIGDNVLSFKSTGSLELSDVEFIIRLASGSATKERDFNLTKADKNLLAGNGKGRIEFDVDSVYRQGVLNIKINSNQLSLQTVREGKNTVDFANSDVFEGANTIAFSGTGSWDISNVKVGIAY
jgi:hypothetical protein